MGVGRQCVLLRPCRIAGTAHCLHLQGAGTFSCCNLCNNPNPTSLYASSLPVTYVHYCPFLLHTGLGIFPFPYPTHAPPVPVYAYGDAVRNRHGHLSCVSLISQTCTFWAAPFPSPGTFCRQKNMATCSETNTPLTTPPSPQWAGKELLAATLPALTCGPSWRNLSFL